MVNKGTSPAEISKQIKALAKETAEVRADAARLDELRRLYSMLSTSGDLTFGTPIPENKVAAKWRAFLMKYHKLMVSQLCDRVQLGRHSAIRCMWGVIAASPMTVLITESSSGKKGKKTTTGKIINKDVSYQHVNVDLLKMWLRAMTLQETEEMDRAMRHMVENEFLCPFRDVQYYALTAIAQLANEEYNRQKKTTSSQVAEKLLELLMIIPIPKSEDDMASSQYLCPPPQSNGTSSEIIGSDEEESADSNSDSDGSDDDSDDDHDNSVNENSSRPTKRQRVENKRKRKLAPIQHWLRFLREYEKAWLAILKLNISLTSLKRSLSFLSHYVLDYIPNPLRFADFFMQAFTDHGSGIVGILALDGLFSLIIEHGLEYPDFYKQLYRLVSPRVLYVKYRSRFYSLLSKCLLRNEMLPAHLVAAFCKRLCRAALTGPPSGALFVLALVSNLLRKHPECACLVHRNIEANGEKKPQNIDTSDGVTLEMDQNEKMMEDKFLPNENDPTKTQALQSSLWELLALERHYYAPVSTLAKSIGTEAEAKAPPHNLDEFSNHTYKSLFDQERKYKKTKKTPLAYKEPEGLFRKDDIFAGILSFGDDD